jgi:hypothetical protein
VHVGHYAVHRVVRLRGILEEVFGVVEVVALEAPIEIRRERLGRGGRCMLFNGPSVH